MDVTFFGRILKYNAKKRNFVVLYSSEGEGLGSSEDESEDDLYDVSLDGLLEDIEAGNLTIL